MIIFNESDLTLINCPCVLQSFENHNGFLLKAYVIGDFFHLVLRPSIRNLSEGISLRSCSHCWLLEHEAIMFNSHDVCKENSRSVLNNVSNLCFL